MNVDRELEHLLDRWLAEGPREVPDRVVDRALDIVERTRQQRAVVAQGRHVMSSTPARFAVAVAAALVVAVGGVALLASSRGDAPAGGAGATEAASPAATAAAASPSALTPPDRIRTAGTVTWCSNLEYPLFESIPAGATEPEGIDMDIAAEIARRWGVASTIRATDWNNLLTALGDGKCDLVISGMTTTVGDRATRADFVEYLTTWTSFIVAAGNPRGIRTVDDLAGKTVAVAPGYLPEQDLRAASDALAAAGKPAIVIDTASRAARDWVSRLASGQTDALANDSTEILTLLGEAPYKGAVEQGGPRLAPAPVGIGVRKDDAGMKEAVAAAIAALYADGTMRRLVDKWGLTDAVGLVR